MPTTALLLLALSAVAHAAWNLLGKGRRPSLAFFGAAEGAMALLGLAAWPWTLPLLSGVEPRFWWLLALSCACQAGYYAGLAAAYRRQDLSAAYPLVRALPVVALVLVGSQFGWRQLSGTAPAGVALVVLGCLLVPLSGWNGWRAVLAGLGQPAILVAAVCGALYTGIDAALARLAITAGGDGGVPALASVMVVGNALFCHLLVFALPAERGALPLPRAELARAALAGVGVWLSYGALLLALPLVDNPGYAAAFRQLSIPLGVLLGVVVLRERPARPRQAGVAGVVAGLVLIAIAPR